MDETLRVLCETIKKIASQLRPQHKPLSFLIMLGKKAQGKTALLLQGGLEEVVLYGEEQVKFFYNSQGIILELDEDWLQKQGLKKTIKQLNNCHRFLRITGLLLCVDAKALSQTEPLQQEEQARAHIQLLESVYKALNPSVEVFILFNKLDGFAGFCEFYQNDHASDLAQPLGFSINPQVLKEKTLEVYNQRFNQLIELLGHQIIKKIHPVRSTLKRSLIREFPLQLLSLRTHIQSFVQLAAAKHINLQGLYFTSAEQGGKRIDQLNTKIEHEYALAIVDDSVQSNNYRAYFIKGAIQLIQEQSSKQHQPFITAYKKTAILMGSIAALTSIFMLNSFIKTNHILDETNQELLHYENLLHQDPDHTQAMYHLSRAEDKLIKSTSGLMMLPALKQLKDELHHSIKQGLANDFLPSVTGELEAVLADPSQSAVARYKALKIYLMLGDPKHFSRTEVMDWFKTQWQTLPAQKLKHKLDLLTQLTPLPLPKFPVKEQYIADTRNFLNALPASYFYYSLAKTAFPSESLHLDIKGFNLASQTLPAYYSKAGFNKVMLSIDSISSQLDNERWVLENQKALHLPTMLRQAYTKDYVHWWKAFLKHSHPLHYQDYQQGQNVYQSLVQNAGIEQWIKLIQDHTSPDNRDADQSFNQAIASQFTDLNLINQSSLKDLSQTLQEMEQFLKTLSYINDGGKTAFNLSKSRFSLPQSTDPLSLLFQHAQRLPQPIAGWMKQLADDSWVLLINDTKRFINEQWLTQVYQPYEAGIAHRYPFDTLQKDDIALPDFKHFFARQGILNQFETYYLKPFLDTSTSQWHPKTKDEYMLPLNKETIDELVLANIISSMFFPDAEDELKIDFILQKIELDPIISQLQVTIGETLLVDNQDSNSYIRFKWPQEGAKMTLDSIEGNHYELAEKGPWALFRLFEKVNVLPDENDPTNLQILFEINSNSGRYLLKTNNPVNPFTPGILTGFKLNKYIL